MSAYQNTPFKQSPKLLQPGLPSYVWGKWNSRTEPTQGIIISDKTNGTTTATVVLKIIRGDVPVVGALVTIVGAANSANFNVTGAAIASVTQVNTPDDGTYSITFPITSTATPTTATADGGQVTIPQPEIGESLAAGASEPVCMPFNTMTQNFNQALTVVVSFPSLPTSVVISLQQAVQDIDAEYATVASVVTVAGGAVTVGGQTTVDPTLGRFFRLLNGTVVGGTLPTVVAKILL